MTSRYERRIINEYQVKEADYHTIIGYSEGIVYHIG